MALPSPSATLSANHKQSLYSRAKFTRAKPDYTSILLGIHHEQPTPVERITHWLKSSLKNPVSPAIMDQLARI
jgi:hypothetical protein